MRPTCSCGEPLYVTASGLGVFCKECDGITPPTRKERDAELRREPK